MNKVTEKKLQITKNIITSILGQNDMNKAIIIRQLQKDFKNSIILKSTPSNNLTVKEYIQLYSLDDKLIKKYKIDKYNDYLFKTLSSGEKQFIQIVVMASSEYDTIILDSALSAITNSLKASLLRMLKNTKKTIINITNDNEEIIYGKKVLILKDNEVILNDDIKNLINDEKYFKQIRSDLPFMISLSLKLKYYNLLDKQITSMDRMVDKLWK